MGVPTNPTLDAIVLEALKMAGERDPSASLIARAKSEWIPEIKNDIWKRLKKPKVLQITAHGILSRGQSRYAYPEDYSSDLTLTLLDGTRSGTAQDGGLSYVVIDSASNATEGELIGKDILITSGTGKASLSQITGFNESTKRVDVTPNFKESPAIGSTYMVIGRESTVEQRPVSDFEHLRKSGLAVPRYFFPMGDENFGEFVLDSPPGKMFGARLRYYANIMRIDVESQSMSTLYRQWESLWKQGIIARTLKNFNDDRAEVEDNKYQREINILTATEKYGSDINSMRSRVVDFR